MKTQDISTNKKAKRDYHLSDKLEAGVALVGTEVKSIRAGNVNIADSYARVERGQLFLYGCYIQPWETAGKFFQHEAKRPRKLLVHKKQILKLEQLTTQKGCTLIATRLYWQGKKVKVEIMVGKGKSHSDQRHDLKKRTELLEAKREMARFNKR